MKRVFPPFVHHFSTSMKTLHVIQIYIEQYTKKNQTTKHVRENLPSKTLARKMF